MAAELHADRPGISWPQLLAVTALAVGFTVMLIVVALANVAVPPVEAGVRGYTRNFSPPTTAFEVVLLHGDGQAYATLAMDPGLRDGTAFAEGPQQAAYFAQRPLLVYGAWALSGGQPDRLVIGFVVMTVLGGAALVAGGCALLQLRAPGVDSRLAIVLLAVPGALISCYWLSHDALATGLSVCGVAAWSAPSRRRGVAALFLCLACLTRETMVLVPVVLAVHGVVRRESSARDLLALAAPVAAVGAWLLVVRWRLGVFPGGAATHNLGLPFTGVVRSMAGWSPADAGLALLIVVLVGAAVWRAPGDPLTWISVAYAALGAVLYVPVWARGEDFSRVLLNAYVFAALVLLCTSTRRHAVMAPARPPAAGEVPPTTV